MGEIEEYYRHTTLVINIKNRGSKVAYQASKGTRRRMTQAAATMCPLAKYKV